MAAPDGGVHGLFVISGRVDDTGNASGCTAVQEDFETQVSDRNVIFRIPTPTFGAGWSSRSPTRRSSTTWPANATSQAVSRHQRPGQSQRQRRDDHPLRLEGAEQVAADLLGRGLQRRDGHHQRGVPARARREPDLPVRDGAERHRDTTGTRDQVRRHRAVPRDSCASSTQPTPASGYSSVPYGRPAGRSADGGECSTPIGCAPCHTPTLMTGQTSTVVALRNQTVNLVLRLRPPQHGAGARRRHRPGRGQGRRVPHRAAVGTRPADLLPPRRAHERSDRRPSRRTRAAATPSSGRRRRTR